MCEIGRDQGSSLPKYIPILSQLIRKHPQWVGYAKSPTRIAFIQGGEKAEGRTIVGALNLQDVEPALIKFCNQPNTSAAGQTVS
jgi:hypothetical protein